MTIWIAVPHYCSPNVPKSSSFQNITRHEFADVKKCLSLTGIKRQFNLSLCNIAHDHRVFFSSLHKGNENSAKCLLDLAAVKSSEQNVVNKKPWEQPSFCLKHPSCMSNHQVAFPISLTDLGLSTDDSNPSVGVFFLNSSHQNAAHCSDSSIAGQTTMQLLRCESDMSSV